MSLGTSKIDFGVDEIEDDDSAIEDGGDEDDYDEDLVVVLDDSDKEDDSDEELGEWAKLETMRYSHPMYFAKKVASNDPADWMEQPPAGLAIQGLIRPALMEEHSDIQRHMFGNQSCDADINKVGKSIETN